VKIPLPLAAALEAALNTYVAMDPEAPARFSALEGRVVGVELRGLDLRFFILPGHSFQVLGDYAGEADAWISGTPLALLRLGTADERGRPLFTGDVEIRGDIDLGRRFQALLEAVDIDWEEHLSRLTGDVVAHQVGNAVRDTLAWGRKAADSLGQDLSEYLREESRLLPTRDEVEQFLAEVDTLREDVDRLEARLRRLQGRAR